MILEMVMIMPKMMYYMLNVMLLLMVRRYGSDAAMMSPLAWLLYYNHNHGFANNVSILVAKPS